MSAPQWLRPWNGGRVKLVDGKERWVIERSVGGIRRSVVLDVEDPDAAKVELSRFEDDPLGYQPKRKRIAAAAVKRTAGAVVLDPDGTVREFLADAQKRVARGDLTEQYVKQVLAPYLLQWAKALNGKDLRTVTLGELKAHLKGKTAEHKRVVALKAFTAWAREGDILKRAEDPTLDLKTPEIIPAKSSKPKGYSVEVIERLYAALPDQLARDIVLLRAKTGMHDTEISRLAAGKAELRRISDPSGIEGVLVFPHLKKGKLHAVSVDAQTFAAAERMVARGKGLNRTLLKRIIDRTVAAMREAETNPERRKRIVDIHPGELRHSFATLATTVGREVHALNQKGVDLAKVAEAMGHLGKRTTSVFYVGDRVPMMVQLPLRLEHPSDPLPMRRAELGKLIEM